MSLSVIIPTLNEENFIGVLLQSLIKHKDIEVIVVDGGSFDATVKLVNTFKEVTLLKTESGRALQMNQGAKIAHGTILFFLHADSILPHNWKNSIKRVMEDKNTVGGSFYLQFDQKHFLLNFYSWCSKIPSRLFTYGDQGLFIRNDAFNRLNGYRNIPILEDYEMVKMLYSEGKVVKLNYPIITSSRRFVQNGFLKQELKNIVIVILYFLGVSPEKLAKWYIG